MSRGLRAIAARIGSWPAWLKVASAIVVAVIVVAAVAIPVTLHLRAQSTASVRRTGVTPSPSPAVFLSPGSDSLVADLTCRLPISGNAPGSGGFVAFPSASFTSDAASNTNNSQRYAYYGAVTYDRAVGKWLSIPRQAVTPDGTRFVYWNGGQSDFHVVTVSTAAETAIGPRLNGPAWQAASAARQNWPSGGPPWNLLDASTDGVYASPPQGAASGGLWFFPYSGATERQIASFGYWQAVGGGAGWGTRAPAVPQGATESIVRVDLVTGVSTDWFSQDGEAAVVSGFDSAGHPVIVTSTEDEFQVWLVDGPQHGTQLLNLPREQPKPGYGIDLPVQSVVGDTTGVWIAASDGLYLYRNGRTQKVSTVTGQISGGCGS